MIKIPKATWIKIAKIAGIVVGIYVLILVIISIYITSSEERLIKTIRNKAEESLLGELKIGKAGLTVWHSFPKISLTLTNVSIADSVYPAPVISAKSIDVKVGLLDLIGNQVEVNSVKLNDATVHIFTKKNGYNNSYIFKSKNKKKPRNKKPLVINNLEFNNVTLISENEIKNKRFEVRFKYLDADMDLSNGVYDIKLEENALIRGLGFNMAKGYWLENQQVAADWKMHYDTAKKSLSIEKNNDVKINGQLFEICATFFLDAANSHFRLDAKTKQIPFDKAMAILKPTTRAKIAKIDLKKPLDVNITLDGPLAYRTTPLVKASWETKNNTLITPVTNLDSVTFNGSFTNQYNDSLPYGDENSNVHFNLFTAKWGSITLTAKQVALTNMRVPDLQFVFFSSTTLPQLNESLGSNTLNFTTGAAKLFISYKGPVVADPALLNRLNAQINISNGEVIYRPTNMKFTECNGVVALLNNNLYINNLTAKLNKSKITVNARGRNLNRISDDEAGKAFIQCNVTSPMLNLADLKKLFGAGSTTATNAKAKTNNASPLSQLDKALENGTLVMNMRVNEVLSNHFKATDVITSISFTQSDWQINKIYMQHAGGTLNVTGVVKRTSSTTHSANVNMDVNKMSISQVMYAFDNFAMQSMQSKNIKGLLTMKSNLLFSINNDGNMLPETLNGYLDLSIKKGALVNFQPIMDIKKFAFKNRDLSHIEFEEIKDRFDIKNGNIYINRMPVQSSAFLIYVEGVYSTKDETNIAIQVPIKTIFNKPDYDTKALSTDKGGASIWLRAKDGNDGKIKIGLDVFKKLRNDKYEDVIFDSTGSSKTGTKQKKN